MKRFSKRLAAISLVLITMISSAYITVNAEEIISGAQSSNSNSTESVKVLFLGNSLFYYNKMDTQMFPQLCKSLGKNVQVDSVTASNSSLCRLSSEKTEEGKQALEKLQQNQYDYVVLQPSRRVSPFEYSVYHAEYKSALKLNEIISKTGAKTLLIASPGVNTGKIEVCSLKDDGINFKINEYLPIDRAVHKKFFENLCFDLVKEMKNADVVRVGEACEVIINNIPNYNSLYKEDNRHPSQRGSYVQAACIFSTIFGESTVGAGYTESLTSYNAILAQRASDVAILGKNKSILFDETKNLTLESDLWDNNTACVSLKNPQTALRFEVYRKKGSSKYVLIGNIYQGENYYVDYALSPGANYTYKVKGFYSQGDLSFQVEQTCSTVLKTLSQPKKPTLSLENKNTIKLKITSVSNAKNYKIYRRKRGSGDYEYIATTSKLTYRDKNLKKGFLYDYKIVAQKQDGLVESEFSKKSTLFVSSAPKFTVVSKKSGAAKINITAVKGANLYVIYYKQRGKSKYKLLTKTSKLKVNVNKLKSGVRYDFKIKACVDKNSAECSSPFAYKTRKIK